MKILGNRGAWTGFMVVLFILWENKYLKHNWCREKRYMEEFGPSAKLMPICGI